jgi:hypothetical protein
VFCTSHVHVSAGLNQRICDVGGQYVRFGGASDRPRVAVSLVVSRNRCHVALGEKDDFSSSIWRRCETTAIRTGALRRVRRSGSKCYAISRGKVHFGHLAARCTAPTIVPSVSTVLARSASHTLLHTLHLNKAIGPHSSPVTFS